MLSSFGDGADQVGQDLKVRPSVSPVVCVVRGSLARRHVWAKGQRARTSFNRSDAEPATHSTFRSGARSRYSRSDATTLSGLGELLPPTPSSRNPVGSDETIISHTQGADAAAAAAGAAALLLVRVRGGSSSGPRATSSRCSAPVNHY